MPYRSRGVGAYVDNAMLRRLEIIAALLAVIAVLLLVVVADLVVGLNASNDSTSRASHSQRTHESDGGAT